MSCTLKTENSNALHRDINIRKLLRTLHNQQDTYSNKNAVTKKTKFV